MIEKAAALGVDGVDVLHRQMEIPKRAADAEHRAYLQKLKRHAFRHGVGLICLSIHQDFVDPEADDRASEGIEHTIKCIEMRRQRWASRRIRLNSGRWNTITSFDDSMKARGKEPVLPGHTEDEGFKWCDRCASSNVCRRRRSAACCSRWKITGASRARPKGCCGSSTRSSRRGSAR